MVDSITAGTILAIIPLSNTQRVQVTKDTCLLTPKYIEIISNPTRVYKWVHLLYLVCLVCLERREGGLTCGVYSSVLYCVRLKRHGIYGQI